MNRTPITGDELRALAERALGAEQPMLSVILETAAGAVFLEQEYALAKLLRSFAVDQLSLIRAMEQRGDQ